MARRHGFTAELDLLQELIDFLDQLCEDMLCRGRIKLLADGDTLTSGSDSTFETWRQSELTVLSSGSKPAAIKISPSKVPKI